MQRVYGVIDDDTFHRMNKAVDESKSSRAQWIGEAIIEKLQPKSSTPDLDVMKQNDEVRKLRDENKRLNDELLHHRDEPNDELGQKILHLNDELAMKDDELTRLKKDAELKWRETSQLRSEVSQGRRELESVRTKADQLQAGLDKKRTETEQMRSEAETLKLAQVHFRETLDIKDKQIGFLEAHVANLVQSIGQLAIKPSEEEAQKKGWWQFWK